MADDLYTKSMLAAYKDAEMREATFFLSSFFTEEKITRKLKVKYDVQRSTDHEAEDIPMAMVEEGQLNEADQFSSKEVEPPLYNEFVSLGAVELYARNAGNSQEVDPEIGGKILDAQLLCRRKIERRMERQASEILFNGGEISLSHPIDGSTSIDFEHRAELDINAAAAWSTSTVDAIGDLSGAGDLIRQYSGLSPSDAIFGQSAWSWLQSNDEFQARMTHVHRNDLVLELPQSKAQGGTYHGKLTVGSWVIRCWTYGNEGSTNPTAGTRSVYVPDDMVAIIGEKARLVSAYGGVPVSMPAPGGNVIGDRLPTLVAGKIVPYVATSPRGLHVYAGCISRPVKIPIALDSWCTIDTNP